MDSLVMEQRRRTNTMLRLKTAIELLTSPMASDRERRSSRVNVRTASSGANKHTSTPQCVHYGSPCLLWSGVKVAATAILNLFFVHPAPIPLPLTPLLRVPLPWLQVEGTARDVAA